MPFFPLQSVWFRRRHCRFWAFLNRLARSTQPHFLQQFCDGKKEQVLLHQTNSSSTVQPFTHVLVKWSRTLKSQFTSMTILPQNSYLGSSCILWSSSGLLPISLGHGTCVYTANAPRSPWLTWLYLKNKLWCCLSPQSRVRAPGLSTKTGTSSVPLSTDFLPH